MSFTDQKPFRATREQLLTNWSGGARGKYFRCHLCGHKFKEGDYVRWQYLGDQGFTNLLVCEECDGSKEDIVAKWAAMHEEATGKMWWFCRE
jgi:hypothetical protein